MSTVHGFSRLTPIFVRAVPFLAITAAVAAVAAMLFFLIKKVVEFYDYLCSSLRDEIIQDVVASIKPSSSGGANGASAKSEDLPIPYKQLEPVEQDKKYIYQLIEQLGNWGYFALLFNRSDMEELGAKVNHLHPLKFLEVIFLQPQLRQCLSKVMRDPFKRAEFMDGLGKRLSEEASRGALDLYLVDFLGELKLGGINLENIQAICKDHKWAELIDYLLEHV